MSIIDVEAFRGKAATINSTIGRFKKSSLHPIFQELGTNKKIFADPFPFLTAIGRNES